MSAKKYCDRCGDEIKTDTNGQIDFFVVDGRGAALNNHSPNAPEGINRFTGKLDLCLTCHKEFLLFIQKPLRLVEVKFNKPKPTRKEERRDERISCITADGAIDIDKLKAPEIIEQKPEPIGPVAEPVVVEIKKTVVEKPVDAETKVEIVEPDINAIEAIEKRNRVVEAIAKKLRRNKGRGPYADVNP